MVQQSDYRTATLESGTQLKVVRTPVGIAGDAVNARMTTTTVMVQGEIENLFWPSTHL